MQYTKRPYRIYLSEYHAETLKVTRRLIQADKRISFYPSHRAISLSENTQDTFTQRNLQYSRKY